MTVIIGIGQPHVGDVRHIPLAGGDKIELILIHVFLVEIAESAATECLEQIGLLGKRLILIGVHGLEVVGVDALPAQASAELDGRLHALAAALGGDYHHTVGRTRAVDGCGRGVLENIDGAYIVEIEIVERIGYVARDSARILGHSVDDPQGLTVARERRLAAYHYRDGRCGRRARNHHIHTGGLALKHTRHIGSHRRVLNVAGRQTRHRAGEVAHLGGAVAYHHHFVEVARVV